MPKLQARMLKKFSTRCLGHVDLYGAFLKQRSTCLNCNTKTNRGFLPLGLLVL